MTDIRNIIFDFGDVIMNIDPQKSVLAFVKLGIHLSGQDSDLAERLRLFHGLETGNISPTLFRDTIRKNAGKPLLSDEDIDLAWSCLLLDIPQSRIKLLSHIKEKYRTFLLSNTNLIHYQYFTANIYQEYGIKDLNELFEKCYYSFELGLRKPDPRIFELILLETGIKTGETLFIDDTLEHVESAKKLGFEVYHLQAGTDITELFDPENFQILI